MIIPIDTPFKVLKYLSKFNTNHSGYIKYEKEKIITYLFENKYLNKDGKKFIISESFKIKYIDFIEPKYKEIKLLIDKYKIEYVEDYYTIFDFNCLTEIEKDKAKIKEFTFQQLVTKYFRSSKYTKKDSSLASAIKAILNIESFIEEDKDQQFLSILYPKTPTRYIILCENKDRLRNPRHEFIEFWYAGGKNIKQLQFVPKSTLPLFYLFDWDYDGLQIYIRIKEKYFPSLEALLPLNPESIMVKQEDVKNHHSKWENNKFLPKISSKEGDIASILMKDSGWIIEEQSILLKTDLLLSNGIK